MKSNSTSDKIFDTVVYAILTLITIITLYPFLNVVALSFNDSIDAVKGGIYIWPRVFTLENYKQVFNYNTLPRAFMNSVVRTILGTFVNVIFTAMVAYTLSRKDFMARKLVAVLFAITMYVNGGLIPNFLLIKELGLYNKFAVYIIPGLVWAFCIFMVRSFIESVPFSVQESAMIDGANDFKIFVKIILPLCKPVLATVALYYAVNHWNQWFDTYLYAPSNEKLTTLQYELQKILKSVTATSKPPSVTGGGIPKNYVTPAAIQMAITVVVVTPIIVVYPFLQNYFVKGMTLGAVKS